LDFGTDVRPGSEQVEVQHGRPHIPAMTDRITHEPDAVAIERLAHKAIRRLPRLFRDYLPDVVFRVAEFADSETLQSVRLSDPWQLIGLYSGRPLSKQSIWASGDLPSIITLFRRPLLNEWRRTGASLEAVVTNVIVHEIGHHFGLSDEQMEAIEDDPS
jgi:predicted Zn-dependent protease with MMP-like domain